MITRFEEVHHIPTAPSHYVKPTILDPIELAQFSAPPPPPTPTPIAILVPVSLDAIPTPPAPVVTPSSSTTVPTTPVIEEIPSAESVATFANPNTVINDGNVKELNMTAIAEKEAWNQDQPAQNAIKAANEVDRDFVQSTETMVPPPGALDEEPTANTTVQVQSTATATATVAASASASASASVSVSAAASEPAQAPLEPETPTTIEVPDFVSPTETMVPPVNVEEALPLPLAIAVDAADAAAVGFVPLADPVDFIYEPEEKPAELVAAVDQANVASSNFTAAPEDERPVEVVEAVKLADEASVNFTALPDDPRPAELVDAMVENGTDYIGQPAVPAAKSFTELESSAEMDAELDAAATMEAEAEFGMHVGASCGTKGTCKARASCSTTSNTIRSGLCAGSSSIICCQPKTVAATTTTSAAKPATSSSSSSSSSKASQFIAKARAQIGKKYARGGSGPSTFDCSGLVNFAARAVGLTTLPRTADDLSRVGKAITNVADRQPGDLIFFGKPGQKIYHVGIYVGPNQMVNAPHTGALVRQENYSYWPDKLTTARRIF